MGNSQLRARRRRVIAYLVIFVCAFFSLWAANALIMRFSSPPTGPPRPVFVDVGMNVLNVSTDQYGLVAEVYATFAMNARPPSENMTLVYRDASSMEVAKNVTFAEVFPQSFRSSTTLTIRFFGDPANFPFDRYDTYFICKFLNGSDETWTTLAVSPKLIVTPETESKWWLLPETNGSSYDLFVVRNPFATLVRFGWMQVAILLLPLSLLIDHKELTQRLAMIIAVLVGVLGFLLQPERPSVVSRYDFLVLWLLLFALLLVLYCTLSYRLPDEDNKTRWAVGLCFLPIPVFDSAFLIEQMLVQSQYSELGAEVWISTLDAGLVVSLVFFSAVIISTWRGLRWDGVRSSLGYRSLIVLLAVLFLPFAFILYSLEMADPFKIPALLIYAAAVLLSIHATKHQRPRLGLSVMFAANLMYLVILAYKVAQQWSQSSYSPLVYIAKQNIAPGFYPIFAQDALWTTLSVLFNFLLLFPTLIPFALIDVLEPHLSSRSCEPKAATC